MLPCAVGRSAGATLSLAVGGSPTTGRCFTPLATGGVVAGDATTHLKRRIDEAGFRSPVRDIGAFLE